MIKHHASKHQTLVVLLQETHCHNAEKLVLPSFALAGATLSRKHGIAAFAQKKLSWSLSGQSSNNSDIEWLCVDIYGFKIINVYKPPPSQMTPTSIPMFSHPCLYDGDFNCQHTNWGYTNEDGSCLATWAAGGNLSLLYNPKGPASFLSGRWGSESNPDLAFASSSDDDQLPCRRVLEKFPRSQHRPSLITSTRLANPIPSKPVIRWNFHKADWKQCSRITDQLSSDLPSLDTIKLDVAYQEFCRAMFSAARETIPRGRRRNYTPCWDEECESLYKDFTSAPEGSESRMTASALLQNLTKKDEGDGTRLSNPLTLPTLVAEHGPLLTTLLATPDTLLVNALFLLMPSLRSRYEMGSARRETAKQLDS